jgi:hypothetical protein
MKNKISSPILQKKNLHIIQEIEIKSTIGTIKTYEISLKIKHKTMECVCHKGWWSMYTKVKIDNANGYEDYNYPKRCNINKIAKKNETRICARIIKLALKITTKFQ